MENIKENPIKAFKDAKNLSWRDVSLHANMGISHIQNLCRRTPDECLELTIATHLKIKDAFGVDLVEYAMQGEKHKGLLKVKEIA